MRAEARYRAARRRKALARYALTCLAVDKRDGETCRVCLFHAPNAHHHHIRFRSQGGTDTTDNLIRVCACCHADIHNRRVSVTGNGDGALTIERANDTV